MVKELIQAKKNKQIQLYKEDNIYFLDNISYWVVTVHFLLNNKPYYIIVPPNVNQFKLLEETGENSTKWRISKGNRNAQPVNIFYYLPFDCNHPRKCSQSNGGRYSHKGPGKYAVDFVVPKGTPISACRSGIVVDVKSDSDSGGPDKSYADDA